LKLLVIWLLVLLVRHFLALLLAFSPADFLRFSHLSFAAGSGWQNQCKKDFTFSVICVQFAVYLPPAWWVGGAWKFNLKGRTW
jgi:hypothetical protein